MTRMARHYVLGLLLIAMAGCAPLEWRRPGTAPEVVAADRAECRDIASRQAWRIASHRSLFRLPLTYLDADGHIHRHFDPFFDDDPFADRFFIERDLDDACLRAKGYDLVPVEPSP